MGNIGIRTFLPDWSRERLEWTAMQRVGELSLDRPRDIDAAVVNLLRHEFTTYDDDQSEDAHSAACEAIAARYPWLKRECRRQVRRRHAEQAWKATLATHEEAKRAEFSARLREAGSLVNFLHEHAEQSNEARAKLAVGMTVTAQVAGCELVGTVVSIHSMVTVAFPLETVHHALRCSAFGMSRLRNPI